MKIKNKGKVHPSPSSAAPVAAPYCVVGDALSGLKMLPAAILALASVLSLEDREVLAYMITRSMKAPTSTSTSTSTSSLIHNDKKKSKKSQPNSTVNNSSNHHSHSPLFDCDCFHCYTSFWFRWDSSANRELIHQAIEAFEDHLAAGERGTSRRRQIGKGKKKDKSIRRNTDKPVPETMDSSSLSPETVEDCAAESPVPAASSSEKPELAAEFPNGTPPETAAVVRGAVDNNSRGLARKMLPDVVGLLNSRLWSLWSPNA
ncbi:uncharacterized protein LOC131144781 [Malania oleifera]|uniref:uncharacterized protein LOC131144781 n=1 Tax=Malania oleifera TaxID=397392 RepID=UPI0025AEB98C|nr:uncharacterized protein LOC131144781 [Malania oleifera]